MALHFISFYYLSLQVEHILSTATQVYMANTCPNVDDKWKAVFRQQCIQLFVFTPYTLPKGVWARYVLSVGTFSWNYMDCFVILVSVGLSQQFKMLNQELRMLKGQVDDNLIFKS